MSFSIFLNDVEYVAKKPKAKIYKKLMKLQRGKDTFTIDNEETLDQVYELLADAIGHPEVTPERIQEELDADQLLPCIEQAVAWIHGVFNSVDLGER